MVSLHQLQCIALACLIGACVDAAPEGQFWVPAVTPAITGFNPFWRSRPSKHTPPPPIETTEAPTPDTVEPAPIPGPEPAPADTPTHTPAPSSEVVTEPPSTETPETVAPTAKPADSSEADADTTKPTTPPTPAPTKYEPPPIPVTGTDSLAKVENPVCDDRVVQTIYDIYSKNRNLFDVCAEKSDYQIFPFSGKLPTPEQINALASTGACTVLFTACVVSKLPECASSGLNLKAVTESLLKVTMDVQNKRPAPDTERFHDMHYWWRDSNLAKAAGRPYGNDSTLYAEFVRDLPAALKKYSVQVQSDLTIVYNGTDFSDTGGNSYFFNTTSGSLANVIAEVHPNDNAEDDSSTDGADAPATDVNTKSAANTQFIAAASLLIVALSTVLLD